MLDADLEIIEAADAWLRAKTTVVLATVVRTWGASPRPPGALLAVREDGRRVGSVSGGCVDDDLAERVAAGERPALPVRVRYGGTAESAERFRLPCGGILELVLETLSAPDALTPLLERLRARRPTYRQLVLASGEASLANAAGGPGAPELDFDGRRLNKLYGPSWRLLLIGAGQVSRFVAELGLALNYEVWICDPREDYADSWNVPGTTLVHSMPDDAASTLARDPRCAVLALSHDPRLDDLALLDALPSPAVYVGALGSHANQTARRARLAQLGLAPQMIARLHGPIGLPIGSRTPAEIAVAIHAELTALRRHHAAPAASPAAGLVHA